MNNYKSVWLSDLHLGTRGSRTKSIISFLEDIQMENLFLVGDIIDCWRLKTKVYWTKEHNEVLRKILKFSQTGTNVTYIPGNHDDIIRNYLPLDIGGIKVCDKAEYTTLSGLKLLIIHGDEFDSVTRYAKWLSFLGSYGYNLLLKLNVIFNYFRRKLGFGYWSLSAYLKLKVKKAVNFISNFEKALSYECNKNGYDGVVCGHIHHPEINKIDGIYYLNDGDFVESCTALIEDFDGSIKLIRWHDENDFKILVELLPNGDIKKYQ